MSHTPVSSAFTKWRAAACVWCAKGSRPTVANGTVHKIYPMDAGNGAFKDPLVKGPFSEYFPCTATEAAYVQYLEVQLAEVERDTKRLDWLESALVPQMTVPQFWKNHNGKVSFAPYDEAKCVEGDDVRSCIDAARKRYID